MQVRRQRRHRAGFIGVSQFLFVVVKACRQTALGVVVHFVRANLKFHRLAVFCRDRCVQALVAVWFWLGNIILDAPDHRLVHAMQFA